MSDDLVPVALVRRGYSSSGGAEAYLLRLAGGLKNQGCEVTLYTSEDWPEERWTFGPLVRLKGRTPQKFAESFAEARDPEQAILTLDRVPGCHVFRAGDGVHAAWLYRRGLFEPKWRKFLHLLNPKHISMMRLECEVFQSVREVIANSAMVADEIVRWHEFPPERIHVVPNGIGRALPTMARDEARRKLDLPNDAFCILFVGTGWERKGLKFAIQAAGKLGPNALLLVAGRGPAHKFRSNAVRFLGPVNDLSALFSAADVFTLPTIYDPFSNACLEALSAGRPVVTTKANGFSEILTPGVHGDVVPAGDAGALADALACWKGRHREETARACQTLAAEYTIERNVSSTLAVLREAAGLS
jgi:UDP-glucose:(heptosyl)LPS alpha-1,3-glucosyltransferase